MMMSQRLVIVGGGPAGMAAAIEAARAGLECTILEASPLPWLKKREHTSHAICGKGVAAGVTQWRLRNELSELTNRVQIRAECSVLSVSPECEVLWANERASGVLSAEQLILATGAYDRRLPFPGWTLPRVIAPASVGSFLDEPRKPGALKAVVAGTGIALLASARRLIDAGIQVVAVLDAASVPWGVESFAQKEGRYARFDETRENWAILRDAQVPIRPNHAIFEARGTDTVERVSYGPVDPADWRTRKAEARAMDVDLVVTGFGGEPHTELAVIAGSRQAYRSLVSAWEIVCDSMMRTSVTGIYSAGTRAGVAREFLAEDEGRVAGITAAEAAGVISADEATRRRDAPLSRLRAAAELCAELDAISRIRHGLFELMASDTAICACEKVSLGSIQSAIATGASDLQDVKMRTRLGMGACQGRDCGFAAANYLQHTANRASELVGWINPRPPVMPVTVGVLARMNDPERDLDAPAEKAEAGGAA
jgi:thioredoxin reductase/bacterioferritin-associated ferredoxin